MKSGVAATDGAMLRIARPDGAHLRVALLGFALVALGGCASRPAEPLYVCELDGCYLVPGYAYRYPYGYGYSPYAGWWGYGGWGYARPYYYGGGRALSPPIAAAPSMAPVPSPDTRVVPFRPSPPAGAPSNRRFPLSGGSRRR